MNTQFVRIELTCQRYFISLQELDKFLALCQGAILKWSERASSRDQADNSNDSAKLFSQFAVPSARDHLGFYGTTEQTQDIEHWAKSELDSGLPYLYNLGAARLWTILEALVDDICVFLMCSETAMQVSERLDRIKGPLLKFANMSLSERTEYLLSELKRALGANLKTGIGRFESILKELQFGGPVDSIAKKAILVPLQLISPK